MRFAAEHRFDGTPADVARLLADGDFYRGLALPDLAQPEVLESSAEGEHLRLRLRYEFTGTLDPIGRRLLGKHRLAWVQELVVDRSTGTGELTFHAPAGPGRLHGSARFTLDPDGDCCVRRLGGEIVVAVPLVGPSAERRILPGLLRRMDIEAAAINDVLARGRS